MGNGMKVQEVLAINTDCAIFNHKRAISTKSTQRSLISWIKSYPSPVVGAVVHVCVFDVGSAGSVNVGGWAVHVDLFALVGGQRRRHGRKRRFHARICVHVWQLTKSIFWTKIRDENGDVSV